jgi:hypothetical protein
MLPVDTSSNKTTICALCGSLDVEFGQLCESCKGNGSPPVTSVKEDRITHGSARGPVHDPVADSENQTCLICGGPFEPYKIGRSFVQKPGQCHACLMRKKYGADWVPGGTKALRKPRKKKLPEQLRATPTIDAQPTATPMPEPEMLEYSVTLRFEGPDEGMYFNLLRICTRERRSLDQQVLFYLDGVLGETKNP